MSDEIREVTYIRAKALEAAVARTAHTPQSTRDILALANVFARYIIDGQIPQEERRW